MTANTNPIYSAVPDVAWSGAITTANTAMDGTGTVSTVFTAGVNGSFVQKVRFRALGTNVASVGRVFINNGSTNATAGNNVLYDEVTLAATTANAAAALALYEITLNIALPAGYKINVTIGTTVAAGYVVTAVGGDY
jgi:hypothetical protein